MEKPKLAIDFRARQLEELRSRLRQERSDIGTQSEVSKLMNVNQGHLSKIETGERLPSEDYITRLARYAGKSYTEESLWLGMGGYLPWTRMPSVKQIEDELEIYCRDIAEDWYPSLIVDYRFGVWAINRTGYNIFGFDKIQQLMSQFFTVFHFLFSNQISSQNERGLDLTTSEPEKTLQQQIILFKGLNLNRRHEPFYVMYLDYIRDEFGENTPSYRLFQHLWNKKTDIIDESDELQLDEADIQISGIPDISKKTSSVIYRQRLQQTFHLPQFATLRFEPGNDENAREALSQLRNRHQDRGVLKLWETTDVAPLLEKYDRMNLIEAVNGRV